MEFVNVRPTSGGFFMSIVIVRRSDSGGLAGEVESIAVPYSGSFTSHSVTAVITKSGNLRLIDWHVDDSGMVTRQPTRAPRPGRCPRSASQGSNYTYTSPPCGPARGSFS